MHKKDFNYRTAEFFLTRTRLTILALFLLVVVGVVATLSLKTVGFPSPEIKLALINTPYPGADAGTVLTEVTEPLQDAIEDVDGVDTYSSTTRDSFSSIFVTLDTDADTASVNTALADATSEVELPDGVDSPKIVAPEIGGADVYLSVYQPDIETRYRDTRDLIEFVESLDGTEEVVEENEFSQRVVLALDDIQLASRGLDATDVERALTTISETLPVVSGVTVDDEQQSIITSIPGELTLESLSEVVVYYTEDNPQGPPTQASATLADLGTITQEYNYDQPGQSLLGIENSDGDPVVVETVALSIKTVADTDQSAYFQEIKDYLADEDKYEFTNTDLPDTDATVVVENYTVAADNEQQVGEVLGGLLGGPLDIDNTALAQAGWLLGGIQLVFLVMLAFVSWRAAIIAAISIPLSLVFTNIYLLLIGENLNTLVLFSFVLVIGLVVDPALVILESIQRKLDAGLVGKAAALAAVRDVGLGLFLATLTNIIVFTPFGIVTGVFGQIIGNIPLTIIPAVVGSYVVPLVFLAWIGSAFMKRGQNTAESEVDNLWGIARGLIRLNQWVLRSGWWLRAGIIVLGLVLAFVITGSVFRTGAVRSVQFASGDNTPYLQAQTEFVAGLSDEEQAAALDEYLQIIAEQDGVIQVFASDQFGILGILDADREQTTREIADDINDTVEDNEGLRDNFLTIQADISANGPPAPLYQVSIAVEDQDLALIQEASLKVGETLQTICDVDDEFRINDCDGEDSIVELVDDGYTGRTTPVLNYVLDRARLAQSGLLAPQGPASILVNSALRGNFPEATTRDTLTTIEVDGETQDLYVRASGSDVTSQAVLDGTRLRSFAGQETPLSDIVTEITRQDSQSAISQSEGETVNTIQLQLAADYADQGTAAQVTQAIVDYYQADDSARTVELGLQEEAIGQFEQGDGAAFLEGFQQLLIALLLAIVFSYFVLAAFFDSLTQPLTILYTIPLTFIGLFPAVAFLSNGQFGFLEIIGVIILVGLVENVAIFLIDSANQLIAEGMDRRTAIATASGIRMRPVILTNLTAIASLAPLALLSETYRPLSLVIIFGLLTSGLVSLVTTPILYIFFRWLSEQYRAARWWNKLLFFPLFPAYIIYWGVRGRDLETEPTHKSKSGNAVYGGASQPDPKPTPEATTVSTIKNPDQFFDHQTDIDFQAIKDITHTDK